MHRNEGPSTRSVHLSRRIDPNTRAIVPPLVENVAFAYDDIATWRAVALHQAPGDIYSRNSNFHFPLDHAALNKRLWSGRSDYIMYCKEMQ